MDSRICAHVVQAADAGEHDAVAGYLAFAGEPDILPALVQLYQLGHQVYLPVIDPQQQGLMRFCQWHPDCELHINRFGIREPADGPDIAIEELNLVLAPLVGFTATGDRLGLGAGYYDRAMSFPTEGPRLTGVAYALQQVETVHSEAWDVPVDELITENGWFAFQR